MLAVEQENMGMKRKAEELEIQTVVKNVKLEGPKVEEIPSLSSTDEELSSQSLSESESIVNYSTPSLKKSILEVLQGSEELQNESVNVAPTINPPEKNCWILHLMQGHVFNQLMEAFSPSNDYYPAIITFKLSKYNLSEAYAEFWEKLFSLPEYTTGRNLKIVNNNLQHDKLLAIARVLKRGWEDERFFPAGLAQPLLEACLFNRDHEDDVELKPIMFYEYIEVEDLEILLKNKGTSVDEKSLEVFRKYCPKDEISIGEKIDKACIKVLRTIMYREVNNIHLYWTPELVGLMDYKHFKFLFKKQPNIPEKEEKDVLTPAPHRIWGTFFFGWNTEMIEFYFKLLRNNTFGTCNFCDESYVVAKHITSTCDANLKNMRKERHECVLNMICAKLTAAVGHSPYFSNSTNWTVTKMVQNHRTAWPEELKNLSSVNLFPHIVIWTTKPRKMALVIEITVSWDYWIKGSLNYDKTAKYSYFVNKLKQEGFKTEFRDIKLGSRGIFSHDLYNLFDEICGMKHSEISKTMEEISKKIIDVAFSFHYS